MACLLLFGQASHGLGFGRPQAQAVIGSRLDFTLPMQLQAGEAFDPDCVRVEVQVGDRLLPPYALRWQVAPGGRDEQQVRVSTLDVLDEPVVSVQVSSGCVSRVSRRVTLLTQLPGAPASAPRTGVVSPEPAPAPIQRAVSASASRLPWAAGGTRPRAQGGSDNLRLDRLLPPAGAATATAAGAVAALALHPLAPSARLPSPADVAMGVQAALADAAVQAAGEQIRSLEQQVQQALAEARRQQEQLAQLRQHLAAAEAANAWLPWLSIAWVASGALAVWLAWRLRRLQRASQQRHEPSPADVVTAPGAAVALAGPRLLSPDPLMRPTGLGAPSETAALPDPVDTLTGAMAGSPQAAPLLRAGSDFSLGTGVPPRPVSVEELLDLDQQVDFFIVLGQEQAAIDLLLSHVRSTGGTNALPYFKLLEIYRQKGDDEAYERTRERFNQRFNAFAPSVDGDLTAGRTLEDYADVVLRLQHAWPQPLRAVAELESLLLRRADLEPFDLPAYREILMLHALVRDLPAITLHPATTTVPKLAVMSSADAAPLAHLDHQAGADADTDGAVDLLLPLGDEPPGSGGLLSPVSERASAQAMLAEWVFTRATQPRQAADADTAAFRGLSLDRIDRIDPFDPRQAVDLDLSDVAPAPREFTRPAVFTDIDQRRDSRLSDLGALDDGVLPPPSRH